MYQYVSQLELKQAWLQAPDIERIKEGIRGTIHAMKKANGDIHALDKTEHCIRGLESGLSPSLGHLKKQWVRATLQKVLNEQRLPRKETRPEKLEDRLRTVSRECSQEAVWWASKMASLDANQGGEQ